jgi:serine/threonine-protein kinase
MNRIGPYELVEPLGAGRFVARRADAGSRGPKVALTAFAMTDDDRFLRASIDEARLACWFSHVNIERIFDLGIAAGQVFIARELVIGATVAELPALPLPIATAIAAGACAGLHYLHECAMRSGPLNVVHRDVSPSTIAAGVDGNIKVLDVGLSRLFPRQASAPCTICHPNNAAANRWIAAATSTLSGQCCGR